jgi:YVTN family beta-propeller protein
MYCGFLAIYQERNSMTRLNFGPSRRNQTGCNPMAYVAWVGVLTLFSLLALYREARAAGIQNLAVGSAEIYNPANGTSSVIINPLVTPRYHHAMTGLADGTFLITGGYDAQSRVLARAEIYNPVTQTFRPTGSMTTARVLDVVAPLPDGTILVAGGADALGNALNTAEIYDPTTGTFTATGSMNEGRIGAVAMFSNLGSGVLIAGGYNYTPSTTLLSSVEFYYPITGSFLEVSGSLQIPLTGEGVAFVDADTVLLAGGLTTTGDTASAELYSTSSGLSTLTAPLTIARSYPTATELQVAGTTLVLVAGGLNSSGVVLSSAELFNPAFGGFFVPTGPMTTPRHGHTANAVNGEALIAGGLNNSGQALASVEIYNPDTNTFSKSGNMTTPRASHQTATLIPQSPPLLITGGSNPAGAPLPKPRLAFVANQGSGTISGYTVDASSGRLRTTGYALNGTSPVSVAVDPSNRFVYAANPSANTVSAYAINSTGNLTSIGTSATGLGPDAVTVDPSGLILYVANQSSNSVSIYTINPSTGAPQSVGSVGSGNAPSSVAIPSQGGFVYVTNHASNNVSAYRVSNPANGALAPITGSPFAAGSAPAAATVDPSGHYLYVANSSSNNVSAYVINQSTGALTPVSGSPFMAGSSPQSLVVDATGQFLYVANFGSDNISAYSINSGNGGLSTVSGSPFAAGTNPQAVMLDPSNSFLYAVNHGSDNLSIYGLNGSTGVLTNMGTTIAGSAPMAIAFSKGFKGITYVPSFAYSTPSAVTSVISWPVTAGGTLGGASLSPLGDPSQFIAVDLTGQFAFLAWQGEVLPANIDPTAGTLTPNYSGAAVFGYIDSLTVDPSDRFIFAAAPAINQLATFVFNPTSVEVSYSSTFIDSGGPQYAAVDPSSRFVYIANSGSNNVSACNINPVSGTLTAVTGSPFPAGMSPSSVAVDPSGRFVYAANSVSNNVSAYNINPVTGALTAIARSPFAAGTAPASVFVDPLDRFVYVANSGSQNVSGYAINPETGALTPIAGSPFPASAGQTNSVNVDPSGRFVYALNYTTARVDEYAITPATGALNMVGYSYSARDPTTIVTTGMFQ